MSNYNIKKSNVRKVGNMEEFSIRVRANKNTFLNTADNRLILKEILDKRPELKSENIKIVCKRIDGNAVNGKIKEEFRTVKDYKKDDIVNYDDDDYLDGKIKDQEKFNQFEFMDIFIRK